MLKTKPNYINQKPHVMCPLLPELCPESNISKLESLLLEHERGHKNTHPALFIIYSLKGPTCWEMCVILDPEDTDMFCYEGFGLDPYSNKGYEKAALFLSEVIKNKSIDLDGYVSASRDLKVAKNFANIAESDTLDKVILKFTILNETGKHYISLDRPDYTSFLDEQEILLQAGIIAQVISVEYV